MISPFNRQKSLESDTHPKSFKENVVISIQAFTLLGILGFAAGGAIFFGLRQVLGRTPLIYLYRMFMYPDMYPLPYIFIVSIAYAFIGTYWMLFFGHTNGWRRRLGLAGALLLSIVVANPFGGMLWVFHDMQAGFFPSPRQQFDYLMWGASGGVLVGPFILLLSIPFNICSFTAGYFILDRVSKSLVEPPLPKAVKEKMQKNPCRPQV